MQILPTPEQCKLCDDLSQLVAAAMKAGMTAEQAGDAMQFSLMRHERDMDRALATGGAA